jgi:DNA-binding transcriptional ArsR family regulator
METLPAIKAFAALAHEGRLALLRHLVRAGPEGLIAGELARLAGEPASTISARLSVLANAGLVKATRQGREMLYRAEFEALAALVAYLVRDCCAAAADGQGMSAGASA